MVKEVKNDSKVGVVTSQFTISMKIEVTGVFYAINSLNKYISDSIQNNMAFAGSTISPVGQAEITINRFDEKTQTADVRVKQEWMAKSDTYGNLIEKKGLTPDYEIEITQKDLDNKKDPQLDKAVELLLSGKL